VPRWNCWRPTGVFVDGPSDLLTRCILATRRAEYDRCRRMDDDAVRAATFAIF
jgi:hypothetical protein